jgi:pimeloyl-ACP methyl ester carboxylesterase
VRAVLEARGHESQAITLSDPERSNLSRHIAEVQELIQAGGQGRIVLVGHSYASFVITGVAAKMPDKIARLVYVDACIPKSGQSLLDVFAAAEVDQKKFGVPSWPPFMEPLVFDQAVIDQLPKTYVHCLRSQFLELTRAIPAYVKAHPPAEHWDYYDLDADHYCMLNHAEALAGILMNC